MTQNASSKSARGIVNDRANRKKTQIKKHSCCAIKSGITQKLFNTLDIRCLKPVHDSDIVMMPRSYAVKRRLEIINITSHLFCTC